MKQAKMVMVALALLALVAGAAQAEMYVEAYIGGNFAANTADPASGFFPPANAAAVISDPGKIDPAFQGGLKIGTWFVKEGVLGFNYPEWMKYLGFYLDFSYHRLNFANNFGNFLVVFPSGATQSYNMHTKTEGAVATLAFMFAARYGFFPDSEVPFGRLQPYVAVGPAIMWSWQDPTVNFAPLPALIEPGSKSSTDVALAAEAGIRWMALKNVSVDVSFKYRYAQPSYSYTQVNKPGIVDVNYDIKPDYNLFSFQVGAAYHF